MLKALKKQLRHVETVADTNGIAGLWFGILRGGIDQLHLYDSPWFLE
jgi:hypothetical protein